MKDVSYDKHSTLLMHLGMSAGMSAGILKSKPQPHSFSLALLPCIITGASDY